MMLKTQLSLTFCFFFALPITQVTAQLIPDNTLGIESSVVTSVDKLNDRIRGGAVRGDNLFHSFTEFNVGEGRGVDFVNSAGVDNIITRVTGSNISNILGKLGVLGDANLFLINPNGIILGKDARLDIAGSFLATTANGMVLGDKGIFNASSPQKSELLSVKPSALFFNQLEAGQIINRSQALGLSGENRLVGLEVSAGKTLAFVGGDVLIEGGKITAYGSEGRIELGSVADDKGVVSLQFTSSGFELGYNQVADLGTVELRGGEIEHGGIPIIIKANPAIISGKVTFSPGSRIDPREDRDIDEGNIIDVQEILSNIDTTILIEEEIYLSPFITLPEPLNSEISQICTPGTKEARSEFIFTGRGGIAPNTLEALQLNPTAPNWVEFPSQSESVSQHTSSTPNHSRSPKIIEAQGWIRAKNGEVILVADASNLTPHSSWQQGRDCGGK